MALDMLLSEDFTLSEVIFVSVMEKEVVDTIEEVGIVLSEIDTIDDDMSFLCELLIDLDMPVLEDFTLSAKVLNSSDNDISFLRKLLMALELLISEDFTLSAKEINLSDDDISFLRKLLMALELLVSEDFTLSEVIFVSAIKEVVETREDSVKSLHKVMTHWVIITFESLRIHKRFPDPLISN
jgi:hypothetical protein